ncbi:MAG: cytidine deaminase [Pseudomonadota bacterium]
MSDQNDLWASALAVREHAYAPYSTHRVGAAIIDEHDRLHVGCNVENAAYPAGNCAETSAIAAMIAAGGRRIKAIAVAGGVDGIDVCTPCGGCRQRMSEFADAQTRVWLADGNGGLTEHTVQELLPAGFSLKADSEGQ